MLFRVVAICAALAVLDAPAVANAPSMRPLQQPQPLMTLRAEQPAQHPNLDRLGHPSMDDLRSDAIEHNGWIYQAIYLRTTDQRDTVNRRTLIYSGNGYPATIMICSDFAPVIIHAFGPGNHISSSNGQCTTVTSDNVGLEPLGNNPDFRLRVRYRILAVHRAAP